MSRYWTDKDAQGRPLTDGRVCLVIEPEDKNFPPIYTYGRDRDEVLEKVAHTAETAQATIARLRNAQPSPTPPAPVVASRRRLTADEQAQATADLSSPTKAPQAIRTLLASTGVDVDAMQAKTEAQRVAAVAQEWEQQHPEFPDDPRNQRMLINTAALRFGFANITVEALDAAYRELVANDMLFEVQDVPPAPVHPDGNPDSRTPVRGRSATSYRSNALRSDVPAAQPKKPKYTRAQIDAMNSAEFRKKLDSEPGFKEWYNEAYSAATA